MLISAEKKSVVPERIRAAGFTEQISPQRDDLTTNRQGLDNCSISNLPEIQRNFSIVKNTNTERQCSLHSKVYKY